LLRPRFESRWHPVLAHGLDGGRDFFVVGLAGWVGWRRMCGQAEQWVPVVVDAVKQDRQLRVRERGKLSALMERGASVTEIEVSLMEFAAYAKGLKNPNFSIGALDQCARRKAMAQA
jgi:hypothetical protein